MANSRVVGESMQYGKNCVENLEKKEGEKKPEKEKEIHLFSELSLYKIGKNCLNVFVQECLPFREGSSPFAPSS